MDGEQELVEKEWYLDPDGWNLLDFLARLEPAESSLEERAESFLIALNSKHLVTRYLGT